MCRQFEWTMCAARGQLPGQNGSAIRFVTAPKHVYLTDYGAHPVGSCRAYTPVAGCTHGRSYAASDIFYEQVCLLSALCKNFFALYTLNPGDDFRCELHDAGAAERFDEVRDLLLDTKPDVPNDMDNDRA